MPRLTTVDRQIEFLTSVTNGGIPGDLLEMAWEPAPAAARGALDRARRADRVSEIRPGIFKVTTGAERAQLSRRDLQGLIRKLRKAVLKQQEVAQRFALARLLLNLQDEVTSVVLDVVATAAEAARQQAPDETRQFLDEVLQNPQVRRYSRQHSRLALAYVGTLTGSDDPKVWRAAFEECYLAATEANGLDATLTVLGVRVHYLLGTGAQREAEAELRHALSLMEDVPSARRTIETHIAQILIFRGELDEARGLLERVVLEAEEAKTPMRLAGYHLNSVLATQLDSRARGELNVQLRQTVRSKDYQQASIAASLGAWLAYVFGDCEEAPVLARDATMHGTKIGRHWRDAERSFIDSSVAFAQGDISRFEEELLHTAELSAEAGHHAVARAMLSLRLRWEILRLDRSASEKTTVEIQEVAGRLQPIYTIGLTGFEAASDLALGRRPRLIPGLRDADTYWGLGGLLAGMEVLATGGSRASAMTIAAWGDEALSKGIVSAPDWPVHLDRLVPLVMLRLGKQNRVPERLAKAAERADAMQHPIEAAIARLQYAEVSEALGIRTQGEAPTATRERAVEELLAFGIVPEPLALTAVQAVLRGSHNRRKTDLSKGQAEVLQLLGEGLTYKDTATRLGLSWRTVQTQAKYAYAKLGAHDRADAVAKARRRGEI